MPKIVQYLDCGCAILEGGGVTRCPSHDAELERQYAESQTTYPTQDELAAESDWEREMQKRAEEDMERADMEREAMEYAQGFERGIE